MSDEDLVRLFWGKAGSGDPASVHPALFHMLDVGMVARELVQKAPHRVEALRLALELDPDQVAPALGFLVALHDLGKVSPGFQSKVPSLTQPQDLAGFPFPSVQETDHARVTQVELSRARGDWNNPCFRAIAAHHGEFHPSCLKHGRAPGQAKFGEGPWMGARNDIIRVLSQAFRVDALRDRLLSRRKMRPRAVLLLAGLTTMADWLGSNETYFPRAGSPPPPLADYLRLAASRARAAVQEIGWGRWRPDGEQREFGALFPGLQAGGTVTPNALQELASRLGRQMEHPGIVLMEAPMGRGKTEAALWLADLCLNRFQHDGIYIALPTQATSNQMFGRFKEYLRHRWPGQTVDVHLLHQLASFHDDYDGLPGEPESVLPRGIGGKDGDVGAELTAATWFRGRKRGLLAPFAVGTVDQALFGVLQTRHMFLRLFGLANKVVIVDEAHAYDVYTTALMERLVAWLAELGCTVIILSATLPEQKRKCLLTAYGASSDSPGESPYPRLSWAEAGSPTSAESVALPEGAPLTLQAVQPQDRDGLEHRVREAVRAGAGVAWFCNTIASAQQTFLQLNQGELRGRVRLLHSQFIVRERRSREAEVEAAFGKGGDRRGQVWVSTQVMEQSLDVDFDMMVSELAPLDLLLQRSGRLHRHATVSRPAGCGDRVLFWLEPPQRDGRPELGNSRFIYHPLYLLQSWWLLQTETSVATGADIERLVEAVYRIDPSQLPAHLACSVDRLQEQRDREDWKDVATAYHRALNGPQADDPFAMGPPCEEEDAELQRAVTRLGEPTLTVVLGGTDAAGGSCLPVVPETPPAPPRARRDWERELILGSVRLQQARWVKELSAQSPPSGWDQAVGLRHCRLVTLVRGCYRGDSGELRLDPELGLVRDPEILEVLKQMG